MDLAGARVVVTGASRGIGAGLATALAHEGRAGRARRPVARRDRQARGASSAARRIPADLADATAIEPLVRAIEADGPIDVLVNNAGVDLTGAFVELDARTHPRAARDQPRRADAAVPGGASPRCGRAGRGHIMNVSSLAGTNALPGLAPYSTSKAGLSHFTAALRAECKGTGITTTLAEIGPVESTMMQSLHGHPPTERALARLRRLQLAVELDMDDVVAALVDGDRARSGATCGCRRETRFFRS